MPDDTEKTAEPSTPSEEKPQPAPGGFRLTGSSLGGVPITGRTQAEIRESIRQALIASGDIEE